MSVAGKTRENVVALTPGLLRMPDGAGENSPSEPPPIAPLIRRIAGALDQAGIPWLVLRNAEGLPSFTRYDVDLLTQPRFGGRVRRIVEEAACECGWQVAGRIRKRRYDCLMLLRRGGDGGLHFLPVDIFSALEFRGLVYLDAAVALRMRIRSPQGIWTLPAGAAAAITLLKEILPHGRIKENSRAAVAAGQIADASGFIGTLERAVGGALAADLAASVLRQQWEWSKDFHRAVRRAIRARTPFWALRYVHMWLANLRHAFRPGLSFVVCLAGPDGSGKTTLARGLAEAMFKRPFKACRYVHGNIGVLPRWRDVRAFLRARVRGGAGREAAGAGEDAGRGHPQALRGMMDPLPPLKSLLLASYYSLDLWLGRLVLRRWRSQWSLVLMDRSFYDYYYQLGHRRLPHSFLDWLSLLVPKPDLLVCIRRDARLIHEQKPELTVEEIEREQGILANLAERLPFACVLDGDAGAESVIQECQRRIFARLLPPP